jgi:hypothetical protein
MRRVFRHFLTIISALSLMLLVGVCVLWARSFATDDAVGLDNEHFISSRRGSITLFAFAPDAYRQPARAGWTFAGFGWSELRGDHREPVYTATVVPYWFCAVAASILPVFWLMQWRRRISANRNDGRCSNCGYDLRASPDRCPECGTAVNPAE